MLKFKLVPVIAYTVCVFLVVSCEKTTFDTKPLDRVSEQTEDIYNKLIVVQQSKENKDNWQKTRNYFRNNISKLLEELGSLPQLEQKPTSDNDKAATDFNQDNFLARQRKNRLNDILLLLNSSVISTDFSYFQEVMEDKSIKVRIAKLKVENKTAEDSINSENNTLLKTLPSSSELKIQEEKLGLR